MEANPAIFHQIYLLSAISRTIVFFHQQLSSSSTQFFSILMTSFSLDVSFISKNTAEAYGLYGDAKPFFSPTIREILFNLVMPFWLFCWGQMEFDRSSVGPNSSLITHTIALPFPSIVL